MVAGASFSSDVAVFEPGARHTYDEGVGKLFLKFVNIVSISLVLGRE